MHIEHVPVSCGANDNDDEEEGEEAAMPLPPEFAPLPPFFSFVKVAGGGRRRRLLTSLTVNGPSIFMSVSPDRRSPGSELRSPDPVSRSRAGLGFELVPSAGLGLERCCCACATAEEEEVVVEASSALAMSWLGMRSANSMISPLSVLGSTRKGGGGSHVI